MEPIMVYFESIPSRDRSLILAGGIAFFWLMETAFPLFKFSYKFCPRFFVATNKSLDSGQPVGLVNLYR